MIVMSRQAGGVRVKTLGNPTDKLMAAIMRVEEASHIHPWTYDAVKACFGPQLSCINTGLYEKEELIGYAVISIIYEDAELWTLGVLPSRQGKGLGRFLLRASLSLACLVNTKMCFLEVRQSNEAAIALYKSEGFVQTGLRKNYYPKTGSVPAENALTMACELKTLNFDELEFAGDVKEFSRLFRRL